MKLKVDRFEIEIKAKDTENNTKFNKEDTMTFLNRISLAMGYGADYQLSKNHNVIASDYSKMSDDIYQFLNACGLYDRDRD